MALSRFILGAAIAVTAGFGIVVIGSGASTARAQQTPPSARIYGSIQINGQNAPSGAVVTAFSGATQCGVSTTTAGNGDYNGTLYKVDLDSSQAACGPGNTISFKVNGQPAKETATVPPVSAAVNLNLTVTTGGSPAPGGSSVTYQPGWNIVAGPAGTTFPQAAASLYNLPAGASDYATISNTAGIEAGKGYWAFFSATTTINLVGGAQLPFSVSLPAGVYGMVGNPSAQTVTISGADVVYAFDPVANNYKTTTTLAPGQGAFILSNTGGTVTLK